MYKRIEESKDLFYKFTFGIFKGFTLKDIGMGNMPRPIIELYLNLLIENFKPLNSNYKNNFEVNFDDEIITMRKHSLYDNGFDKSNEGNFSLINDYFINCFENYSSEFDYKSNSFIHRINELPFANEYRQKDKIIFPTGYDSHLENGSPNYIEWCINNIDSFFVPISTINFLESVEIKFFKGIKLIKLTNIHYKIAQDFKLYRYNFSDTTLDINMEKNNSYMKLTRREHEDIPDDYENPRNYSDQDYIDDAFGGEASAYWNID